MGDYETTTSVARHASGRKDRHRRKKYRRDRVRPEDRDDLGPARRTTPGRTSSRTATRMTTATTTRSAVAVGRRRRRPSGPHKGDDDDVMVQVQGSWPRSCTARSSSTRPWRGCSTASASCAGARRARRAEPAARQPSAVAEHGDGAACRTRRRRTGERGGLTARKRRHAAAPPRRWRARTDCSWTEYKRGRASRLRRAQAPDERPTTKMRRRKRTRARSSRRPCTTASTAGPYCT